MKNLLLILIALLTLEANAEIGKENIDKAKMGLIIVDAQKWFIPGHPESLYELWGMKGYDRVAPELISAMDSVITWANQKKLSTFVTYEANDTGQYDLPAELKNKLNPATTKHFVKFYYAATKHKEFDDLIKNSGIRNWIVIGAETDVCVYQTVKELLKKNMNVALVKEAIYSGRNNTEVAINNLVKFGADTIHVSDLYKGSILFKKSNKNIEENFSYSNCMITIIMDENENSNLIRLEYLKKYAKIIGIPIEEVSKDSAIKSYNKTRLLAGNLTLEQFNKFKNNTKDTLIVVSDCINTPHSKQPKVWHKMTLKMVFYELMETAAFYAKSVEELTGWQKELKKAMNEGRLDYVESSQNLN